MKLDIWEGMGTQIWGVLMFGLKFQQPPDSQIAEEPNL